MRIGFLGNSNNYPLMLARAMRKLGHDVFFIVDRPSASGLDRPENRYADIAPPYPHWIRDVSGTMQFAWNFPAFCETREQVIRMLQACDAVVLNHGAISLSSEVGRPAIALLTGTDIEFLASTRYAAHAEGGSLTDQHLLRRLISCQREGIRGAVVVSFYPKGLVPSADATLDELGVPDFRRTFCWMTNLDGIEPWPMPRNPMPRVFCVARLTWRKPMANGWISELDYKGSDIMVRGLGLHYRTTGVRVDIRLAKKGLHITETAQLLDEEGIADQVTWVEEMSQLQVMKEYRKADVVIDQLGAGMVGMGGWDAMAAGRPLIANGRPEVIEPLTHVVSPICQAETPEGVCSQLHRLIGNRTEQEEVGKASRRYVEEFCSPERAAKECVDRLEDALNHREAIFQWRSRA